MLRFTAKNGILPRGVGVIISPYGSRIEETSEIFKFLLYVFGGKFPILTKEKRETGLDIVRYGTYGK